jgi:hypothetical protein
MTLPGGIFNCSRNFSTTFNLFRLALKVVIEVHTEEVDFNLVNDAGALRLAGYSELVQLMILPSNPGFVGGECELYSGFEKGQYRIHPLRVADPVSSSSRDMLKTRGISHLGRITGLCNWPQEDEHVCR